jgi:DNA-binding transcriptional LysR family regulator
MIQLYQLEGFYRVAKAAGYARAVRAFPYPITQPGVHAQVRKLEAALGVRLFEQVAKDRLVPTRPGRDLLSFCAPFFEHLPEIVRAVAQGGASRRLRVQAGALEIQEILPDWVRRVRAKHPDIDIELSEIDATDQTCLLRDEVDIIVDHQPNVARGVSTRVVAEHRSFLVAPSNHPAVRRPKPTIADFVREPFVAFPATLPQATLQMAALGAVSARPAQITRAPSVVSILSFVAAGLGYSLVPWPDAQGPRMRGVTAFPLRGKGTRFPVVAAWRTRRIADPVLDAVLGLAPSCARVPATATMPR